MIYHLMWRSDWKISYREGPTDAVTTWRVAPSHYSSNLLSHLNSSRVCRRIMSNQRKWHVAKIRWAVRFVSHLTVPHLTSLSPHSSCQVATLQPPLCWYFSSNISLSLAARSANWSLIDRWDFCSCYCTLCFCLVSEKIWRCYGNRKNPRVKFCTFMLIWSFVCKKWRFLCVKFDLLM